MRSLTNIIMAAALGGALTSCGNVEATLAGRSTPSTASEDSTLADAQLGAAANNQLGAQLLKLLSAAAPGGANTLIAPVSISTTLAMLADGAAGPTATELTSALGFPAGTSSMNDSYGSLTRSLDTFALPGPVLASANRVWAQQGLVIEPRYQDVLARYYQAGVGRVDFAGDSAAAVTAINQWVEAKTQGTIKDMLSQLGGGTQLILTNALYFKGAWQKPFASAATLTAPFHAPGGDVPVKMMGMTDRFAFVDTGAFRMVELPYAAGTLTMDLVLPAKAGDQPWAMDGFAQSLQDAFTRLSPQAVAVHLPSFTSQTSASLATSLQALGVKSAFSDAADFSEITGKPSGLTLADVVHRTFIGVTELGTEAGASTAAVMFGSAEVPEFTADRPFAYAIRDTGTGALVFLGVLVDPSH